MVCRCFMMFVDMWLMCLCVLHKLNDRNIRCVLSWAPCFFSCFSSRKPLRGDRHPNVLILVPSLELGVQVTLVAQQIAQAWRRNALPFEKSPFEKSLKWWFVKVTWGNYSLGFIDDFRMKTPFIIDDFPMKTPFIDDFPMKTWKLPL